MKLEGKVRYGSFLDDGKAVPIIAISINEKEITFVSDTKFPNDDKILCNFLEFLHKVLSTTEVKEVQQEDKIGDFETSHLVH